MPKQKPWDHANKMKEDYVFSEKENYIQCPSKNKRKSQTLSTTNYTRDILNLLNFPKSLQYSLFPRRMRKSTWYKVTGISISGQLKITVHFHWFHSSSNGSKELNYLQRMISNRDIITFKSGKVTNGKDLSFPIKVLSSPWSCTVTPKCDASSTTPHSMGISLSLDGDTTSTYSCLPNQSLGHVIWPTEYGNMINLKQQYHEKGFFTFVLMTRISIKS